MKAIESISSTCKIKSIKSTRNGGKPNIGKSLNETARNRKVPPKTIWSRDEISLLRELADAGLNDVDIAKRFPLRYANSVYKKRWDLGI